MFCTRRTSSGSRCIGSTQAEQRALRIGARDDGARGDRFAGGERHAGGGAVSRRRSRDLGAGSDLDAGLPRGCGQRVGERARSAAANQPLADRMAFAGAEQQQQRGAARRPRPEKRAEHAAGGDRRAQRLALEPFARQIRDRPSASSAAAIRVASCRARGTLRPVFSSSNRSAGVGSSIDGGAVSHIARSTRADAARSWRGSAGTARRPSARRRGCSARRAPRRARARARGRRASARRRRASGRMIRRPCRSRPSARTIAGSIAAACASVGQRKPGAISSVVAQPPTRSPRSRTSGFRPAFARRRRRDQTVVRRRR